MRKLYKNNFLHVFLTFARVFRTLLSLATAQSNLDVHGFLASTLISKPSGFYFGNLLF